MGSEMCIRDRAIACNVGMSVLREDGLEKIKNGLTTQTEVDRVSMNSFDL